MIVFNACYLLFSIITHFFRLNNRSEHSFKFIFYGKYTQKWVWTENFRCLFLIELSIFLWFQLIHVFTRIYNIFQNQKSTTFMFCKRPFVFIEPNFTSIKLSKIIIENYMWFVLCTCEWNINQKRKNVFKQEKINRTRCPYGIIV